MNLQSDTAISSTWLSQLKQKPLLLSVSVYCALVKFYQASQHTENLHATGFHITASSVESYLHLKTIPVYSKNRTSSLYCSKLRHRIATWNWNKEAVHFFI